MNRFVGGKELPYIVGGAVLGAGLLKLGQIFLSRAEGAHLHRSPKKRTSSSKATGPMSPLLGVLAEPTLLETSIVDPHHHTAAAAAPGTVYLVGAGPGGVGLLTVRGFELLQQADMLVMDELADPDIAMLVPMDCEQKVVGKRGGRASSAKQPDINQVLIEAARRGLRVVRLKGGDPLVFGRVQQEMVALQAAGVPYELVPGITSALSAPAAAGIPVTDKELGRAFVVLSAHDPSLHDWSVLAKIDTLVILMGTRKLGVICAELIKGGLDPSTPVCIVQWANTPKQRVVTGTVETICDVAKGTKLSPAIITIGKVVGLAVAP